MTSFYQLDFQVNYKHRVVFTRDAFSLSNPYLNQVISCQDKTKILVVIEQNIITAHPQIITQLQEYLAKYWQKKAKIKILSGGEELKQSTTVLYQLLDFLDAEKIDRHSYVWAIGGGSLLDVAGFATATAHRGCRFVRFPTTTLAQGDSGVGVKNGINLFNKKNWLGVFAVPYAVINDFTLLYTQPTAILLAGVIEAVKVALVKDAAFFAWIYQNRQQIKQINPVVFEELIERSAYLHAQHITEGGDPFELGNSRPLDYGHWLAHKLEQMSTYQVSHAEAVSVGLLADSFYAKQQGWLQPKQLQLIITVVQDLGLMAWHPLIEQRDASGKLVIFNGLEEFREHLGGELTLMFLRDLGEGFDCHNIDEQLYQQALDDLKNTFH